MTARCTRSTRWPRWCGGAATGERRWTRSRPICAARSRSPSDRGPPRRRDGGRRAGPPGPARLAGARLARAPGRRSAVLDRPARLVRELRGPRVGGPSSVSGSAPGWSRSGSTPLPSSTAVRASLAAHVVELTAGRGRERAAVPRGSAPADRHARAAAPRPLHLLHRGDAVLARSPHRGRDRRGRWPRYLASYADLAPSGSPRSTASSSRTGDRALLVPEPDDPVRFRHALTRRGARSADVDVAVVDAGRAEIVVGAPGLTVDDGRLGRSRPTGTLPWGRYPLDALVVAGPADASGALLELRARPRPTTGIPTPGSRALLALHRRGAGTRRGRAGRRSPRASFGPPRAPE